MSEPLPAPPRLSPAVVRWGPPDLRRSVDEALVIYATAMGYPLEVVAARKGYVLVHTERPGFRAVAALDGDRPLVGFGYGYAGAAGQWWHDEVRNGLDRHVAAEWLADAFELCELHLLPDWHGRGLGRAMLVRLLASATQSTVVLSTPEGDTRAWRLYRRLGFRDVRRGFRFPGDDRKFAVLGRHLPLEPALTGG